MTPTERGGFVLQRMMRELRLFQKYGITDLRGLVSTADSPWRKLALALAERYENGFKLRGRGRPKEHDDDPELILMVELLRCRDRLSIAKACKVIAEKGAIKGKPKTLQDHHKTLMRNRHWKVFIHGFELAKAKVGADQYIKVLEEMVGGKIN